MLNHPGTSNRCVPTTDNSRRIIDLIVGQTPLRRAAQPEEVAEAAAWLLSDRSSYVTGAVLQVDGGLAA